MPRLFLDQDLLFLLVACLDRLASCYEG
ncbi:hypothetical protein A2U01_0024896, partial [Trifolium medium]|nr:hypothetical protein [Trifolium medium]